MLEPLEPPFEERQAAIMERIAPGQERPLGLFRLLAHNPDMFEAFLSYGSYNLSRKCSLSIHDRELVIFRAAGRAHGEYEWGSPKLPMTVEAIALHHLDNLDAKIEASTAAIENDRFDDGNWTEFNRMFQRRLYRGTLAEPPEQKSEAE